MRHPLRPLSTWWVASAAIVLSIACLGPLLLEPRPVAFIDGSSSALAPALRKLLVALLLAVPVALRIAADFRERRWLGWLACGLVGLAVLFSIVHWRVVDTRNDMSQAWIPGALEWQRDLYLAVFNAAQLPPMTWIPHVYRPLPYGFTRALERLSGDWLFAFVAYRLFFHFWFLWAFCRFVAYFRGPWTVALALAIFTALYPLSVATYIGQLTDPLTYALFFFGLLFLLEDRRLPLAVAIVLGVLAKESAIVLLPAYAAVHWRKRALLFVAAVALAGVAAYLSTRLPLGWRLGSPLHGMSGLMIAANLEGHTTLAPGEARDSYRLLLLFVGVFLPFIAMRWRRSDSGLKVLFLVLTPLVVLGNLAFSWGTETRNYIPLLPILAALAIAQVPAQPVAGVASIARSLVGFSLRLALAYLLVSGGFELISRPGEAWGASWNWSPLGPPAVLQLALAWGEVLAGFALGYACLSRPAAVFTILLMVVVLVSAPVTHGSVPYQGRFIYAAGSVLFLVVVVVADPGTWGFDRLKVDAARSRRPRAIRSLQ